MGGVRTLTAMNERQMGHAVAHPAQQRLLPVLSDLITQLRACRNDADYFAFQKELLAHRQQHETWRAECARAADRAKKGKQPKVEAPAMEVSGGDPTDSHAWNFQADVYTRLTHQLRSIGDGLAWTILDYRRDLLVALSRSRPPGPMDPTKTGTKTEIDFVDSQWHDQGRLALMHDLTNCLRIADVTVLNPEQSVLELYELKSNPRRKDPAQVARIRTAARAVARGGSLPGDDPSQRLITVPIPYATHLDLLRTGTDLAYRRGAQTVAVAGGRAIEVYHLPSLTGRWDEESFAAATGSRRREAARRAGVRGDEWMRQSSVDVAGNNPLIPPWAIYPLPAHDCARLIANHTIFSTTLSLSVVQESLRDAGVRSWRPTPEDSRNGDETVLFVERGFRRSGMGVINFQPLLMELIDVDIWARGVAHVLDYGGEGTKPWPVFQDERRVWT